MKFLFNFGAIFFALAIMMIPSLTLAKDSHIIIVILDIQVKNRRTTRENIFMKDQDLLTEIQDLLTEIQEKSSHKSCGKKHKDEDEDENVCNECSGGITTLTLMYNGSDTANMTVVGENGEILFNKHVNSGEQFSLIGNHFKDTDRNKLIKLDKIHIWRTDETI